MGKTVKRLCTICARGGSKGVKNKNIRLLLGKPLIAHTLEQAKTSGLFQAAAVTSDSEEILKIAGKWGADFVVKRPAKLATDRAPKLPAIRHCVREVEARARLIFDTVCDLDPTSPLRNAQDITGAVRLLEQGGAGNVITGAPARRSPYFNLVELGPKGTVRLSKPPKTAVFCRQDAPKCYDMNASIYVWRRDALFEAESLFNRDTRLYQMPPERSLDIDSELDLELVGYLMGRKR
ncbi:MAG: acylneuraminate cytidylyltransferase family protein [Candidatus Omnitrophica bacterium]|nr:acylneuraminate cytidylyltransferase family protein [Candidatus Omnitrophota bacterium]